MTKKLNNSQVTKNSVASNSSSHKPLGHSIIQWVKNSLEISFSDWKAIPMENRRNALKSALDMWVSLWLPKQVINRAFQEASNSFGSLDLQVASNPAWSLGISNIISSLSNWKRTLESDETLLGLRSENPDSVVKTVLAMINDRVVMNHIVSTPSVNNAQENWQPDFKQWYQKLTEDSSELISLKTNWDAFGDFSWISHKIAVTLMPFAPDTYLQKIIELDHITLQDISVLSWTRQNIVPPSEIEDLDQALSFISHFPNPDYMSQCMDRLESDNDLSWIYKFSIIRLILSSNGNTQNRAKKWYLKNFTPTSHHDFTCALDDVIRTHQHKWFNLPKEFIEREQNYHRVFTEFLNNNS